MALPAAWVWSRAAAASQGLGQFASSGPPPCKTDEKPTPAAPEGPNFKSGAPPRSSLVGPSTAGTRFILTGTVSGLTCGPIKRARLDFWQADAHGVYDKVGFTMRGQQFTDANGAYQLETIVPGTAGTGAPRLHVKVQPPGKSTFTTQLFFPDQPQNTSDPNFHPELVLKFVEGRGVKTATFNIVLSI